MAVEAFRIATKHMLPVIYLSDGYLANGAEPWRLPAMDDLPKFEVKLTTDSEGFNPYNRDPETLARPWAVPGTPNLEHRIGGIEKEDITGNVSYEPENHMHMVLTRAGKGCADCLRHTGHRSFRRTGRPFARHWVGIDLRRDYIGGRGDAATTASRFRAFTFGI